jgi:hypothetical protein
VSDQEAAGSIHQALKEATPSSRSTRTAFTSVKLR